MSTQEPQFCDAWFQDTIDPIPDAVGHKSKESSTQTAVYYTEDSETQAPVLRTIAVEACIASEIPGQEEAQSSQQFLGTDESRHASIDSLSNECLQHEYTLSAFDTSQGHGNKQCLVATSLAWHPNAISIAITLGVRETKTFCTQGGALAIWNLASEVFQPATPHLRLEAEFALQAAAYHPHVPALIAAGTANGGIHVWNLANDHDNLELAGVVDDLLEARLLDVKKHNLLCREAFSLCHRLKNMPQAPRCTKAGVDSAFLVGTQAGVMYECGLAMQSADQNSWKALNKKGESRVNVSWRAANTARALPMPKQPHIGEVSSEGGQLSVFDLSINTLFALQTVSVGMEDEPIAALEFSPPAPGTKWLAVTSGDTVIIFRVGERLVRSYHDKEHGKQFLQSLADGA